MGFENEFASYEPLRRLLDSEKVKSLKSRFLIRKRIEQEHDFESSILKKSDLPASTNQASYIIAIDGSVMPHKAQNGFPGAEFGYITVASVLIDLMKVRECADEEFISPKKLRETEKLNTIESVFP